MTNQAALFTFIDRVNGDTVFIDQLKTKPSSEWMNEIRALGKTEGVEFEDSEYYSALSAKFGEELSEVQLDQVSGGACSCCSVISCCCC